MQEIAVTGGTGFFGAHLCRALLGAGYGVRCLTRSGEAPAGARRVAGDLDDADALHELLCGASIAIHLAAATRGGSPARFSEVNLAGTHRVIDAAVKARCVRFLYVSTDLAALACDPYGQSKRDAEDLVADSDLTWTILRFPALYGPSLMTRNCAVESLAEKVRSGRVFVPGNGRQRLSFLHTEDACEAVLRTLTCDETQRKCLFVGPQAVELDEAVRALAGGAGVRCRIVHVPWSVARATVRTALGAFRALPLNVSMFLTIDQDKVLDGTPFERLVGWRPTPTVDGLHRFAATLEAEARTYRRGA